jgi:hypothetical protein
MTLRQEVVFDLIGNGEMGVAEIVAKVSGRKALHRISSIAQRVHEIISQLERLGLVSVRKQAGIRAPIRIVSRLRHPQ